MKYLVYIAVGLSGATSSSMGESPFKSAFSRISGSFGKSSSPNTVAEPRSTTVVAVVGTVPIRFVCTENYGRLPTVVVEENNIKYPAVVGTAAHETDLGAVFVVESTGCLGYHIKSISKESFDTSISLHTDHNGAATWPTHVWLDRFPRLNTVGIVDLKLDSDFARSVGQFALIMDSKRSNLFIGDGYEQDQIIYVPVSDMGVECGYWQFEGILADSAVELRIDSIQTAPLAVPEYLHSELLSQLSLYGTISVHEQDFRFSEVVRALPTIEIGIAYGRTINIYPSQYIQAETGKILIELNVTPGEGNIVELGLSAFNQMGIDFDVQHRRIGFFDI
jgi:hypothetical protein